MERDASKSKLQARLERPPENWADAVVIAVVKDPYFYGGCVLAVFLVLSLVALWATRQLIHAIDEDERAKKKAEKKAEKNKSKSDKKRD